MHPPRQLRAVYIGLLVLFAARRLCHAMLMRHGKASVHGCHCPGDMTVRMRKVRADNTCWCSSVSLAFIVVVSSLPPVPQLKLREKNKRETGIEVGFLPGALGDVIAVICAPATSLTSVTGIDSFGTIGISR